MSLADFKNILFTRSLNDKHRQFASELGLSVTDKAFIQIELTPLSKEKIDQLSEKQNMAWIFTSQNAVKVIENDLKDFVGLETNKFFAVGEKTAEALMNLNLDPIVPDIHNSEGLLALLEKESDNSYVHFTGNLRQNLISEYMIENEKDFMEIECYRTNLVQPEIEINHYDAICFCSPSAAISFFSKYKIKESTPCLAIGGTTAVKLLDYSEVVVMSDHTNVFSLLESCHNYLNS